MQLIPICSEGKTEGLGFSFQPSLSYSMMSPEAFFLFRSVQFSCLVMSNSLHPHGLQHARPPCPSPTPRVYSNSCPLSQWCHPTNLILCGPLLFPPSVFPKIRVFSNESVLHIRWPKYWSFSFSISPSNEYSGLISFRLDLLDLCLSLSFFKINSIVFCGQLRAKSCQFFLQVSLGRPAVIDGWC